MNITGYFFSISITQLLLNDFSRKITKKRNLVSKIEKLTPGLFWSLKIQLFSSKLPHNWVESQHATALPNLRKQKAK